MRRHLGGVIIVVVICVSVLYSALFASSEATSLDKSKPATRPDADIAAYKIPSDAAPRVLPCRPGFPYTKLVGYFTGQKADDLAAKRYYWPNGELYEQIMYRNDKKFGLDKSYYSSGSLKSVFPFRNDLLDGPCYVLGVDGKLIGSFQMENGTGTIYEWDDKGHLSSTTEEIRGVKQGTYRTFYPNGKVEEEQRFWDGL